MLVKSDLKRRIGSWFSVRNQELNLKTEDTLDDIKIQLQRKKIVYKKTRVNYLTNQYRIFNRVFPIPNITNRVIPQEKKLKINFAN